MNTKIEARINAAELAAIRQLSDEALDAAITESDSQGDYSWISELSDAEIEAMMAGGSIPARFADCASSR